MAPARALPGLRKQDGDRHEHEIAELRSAGVGAVCGRPGLRYVAATRKRRVDAGHRRNHGARLSDACRPCRSEEHTSELQSLMRISYAVFCLKKKKKQKQQQIQPPPRYPTH